MTNQATPYSLGTVRELLRAAFTPETLRRFCGERPAFRPVCDEFSPADGLNDLIDHVVAYCETRYLLDDLLAQVKEEYPRQYARFARELGLPRPPLPDVACPYRGLEPFEAEHAEFYFGRESMVEHLLATVADQPFVAVVGASGCGKSSLVRAGLVTALRHGALDGSEHWAVHLFRPGADPLRALASPLVEWLAPGGSEVDQLAEVRKLANGLREGTILMADVAARLREKQPDLPRLMLIADQFEELYTECRDEKLRQAFIGVLLAAAEEENFTVVLTLRADFYGHVLSNRRLGEAVDTALVNVLPMSEEELRTAIEQPALKTGRSFEPGLVERILADVAGEPGNLPLLEFALTELWVRQSGQGLLPHGAYEAIGGVAGAISQRAEAVYSVLRDKGQEETARRILLRLTHYGEGAEGTRRRATLDELVTPRTPQGQVEAVIKVLADARLLVTGGEGFPEAAAKVSTAEVSHEKLIDGWERLRRWLDEDRAFGLWRERLALVRRTWQETGQDEGALLRGAPLSEAEGWLADRGDDLNEAERAFVEASLALRQREAAAREAQRQRELEAAQALAREQEQRAEEQVKASRRLRWLAAGLAVVFVLALAAAGLAVWRGQEVREQANVLSEEVVIRSTAVDRALAAADAEAEARQTAEAAVTAEVVARQEADARRLEAEEATELADARLVEAEEATELAEARRAEAERQGRLALARQLASQATSYRTRDLELALLLATQAVSTTYGVDGYVTLEAGTVLRGLLEGLYAPVVTLKGGHTGSVHDAAFSPDGARIVTASSDDTARVWDAATGGELAVLEGHSGDVVSVAFSPDGARIVTASWDTTARVWDGATGAELAVLEGHTGSVYDATFSPDGARIVTASSDRTARVWDAVTGEALGVLEGHTEGVRSAAFNPDGTRIVTASWDNTARVWDAATGAALAVLEGHKDLVWSAEFSPDGTRVVTASGDDTARVWDTATGAVQAVLEWHTEDVTSAEFSPDGTRVVTASEDRTARVWAAATGAGLAVLEGHTGGVRSAAFSPDGMRVATASWDKTARVWDAATGEALAVLEGHRGGVVSSGFSPDGTRVVTASDDSTARVWDAAAGEVLAVSAGHAGSVHDATFSPDGARVVTASDDSTARVWDAATGAELTVLKGHSDSVRSAAFSRDGARVVTASEDGTARVWDAATGAALAVLEGHTEGVRSAAFSRDGARVVTASEDGTARVWDATTGGELAVLEGHTGKVYDAAFSPDGTRIVTTGEDSTARVWDAATGAELAVLEGHTGEVRSAAFSPDGTRVVTASWDGTARVWDAAKGAALAVLEGHTGYVVSAAFSTDGSRIVTAGGDGTARVWDAATGREWAVAWGHTGSLGSAAFSPDGARLVTAGSDGTARVWAEPELGRLSLAGHREGVWQAEFDPEGRWIASAGADGVARIWDAQSGQEVARLEGHGQSATVETECAQCINAIDFGPSGDRLATAGWDGTVRIWNVPSGEELVVLEGHSGRLNDVLFHPEGTMVATSCGADKTVRLWDPATGKELLTLQTEGTSYLDFSSDGRRILAAGADGRAWIWEVGTGQMEAELEADGQALIHAVFSPDGEQVAAAGFSGTGHVWEVKTGQRLATLQGHSGVILQIAYSPRGDLIATAGEDGTARLWKAEDGQEFTVLRGHEGTVWSVAFRPDGEQVATGGSDGTVRLWSTRSGDLEAILPEYLGAAVLGDLQINWEAGVIESTEPLNPDWVYSVRYSLSGDRVVAANLNGSVEIYSAADAGRLLEVAQSRVRRGLTCQERVQFLHEDLDCSAGGAPGP